MITSFNPDNKVQFEMYSKLFAKAYAELKDAGKLTPGEIANGRFTSLDEYFAHMADLYSLNINYIMVPLDEETEGIFKINANDRTITIPSQFSKCAAVQSDEMCEIAVFTIDRYYDFQDLDGVSICVQWVNANDEEGISHIQLKDLETFPGKLRFGWPLTSDITKKAGPVQFAVRFYKAVTDETGKITNYHYLLNTLTSTITVRPSLTIDNPKIEEENVSGLFASFIANSANPSFQKPVSPFFVAPGQDLIAEGQTVPGYGAIDLDTNSLTMTAQAVANDLGTINYRWMFIPADGNGVAENLETYTEDPETGKVTVTVRDGYSVNHQDWLKLDPQPEKRDGSQKYYTEVYDEDGELKGHELYLGTFPAEEDLWIVRTTLTIEPSDNQFVVGEYFVNATNTYYMETPEKTFENVAGPNPSTKCVVPAPNKVEIVEGKDLPNHIFTNDQSKTVTLGVDLVTDPTKPAYFYQWSSTDVNPEGDLTKLEDVANGKDAKLIVAEPGWYALHIDSQLNRRVKDKDTNICKVTHSPEKPKITAMWYAALPNTTTTAEIKALIDGTSEKYNWTKIEDYESEATINVGFGTFVLMKIDTDLDGMNPLYTEALSYKWMVQKPDDSTAVALEPKDIGPNELVHQDFLLGTKVLVVRSIQDNMNFSYHCEITNTIQTKTATTDTSDTYTFTIN